MSGDNETIVAVATPAGRGGVGMVRISGPVARSIAQGLCGRVPRPRHARYASFRDADGETIDRGLALYFPAPHSFTGEDVLELHAHGSPPVLARIVRRACELGARAARAGEFSERAFLAGKLDLAQAEAVADLIAAGSEAQARAALRSLDGEFSRRVAALAEACLRLQVTVEATIDFAEDAGVGAAPAALDAGFAAAGGQLEELRIAARRGQRLTDGLHVVIVGAPNVGKSSLLNALAGNERAIVTPIPGTTRDVLREAIRLDGVEITLADTAGLRDSRDPVEGEGIRRARAELARADLVVEVVEAGAGAGAGAADADAGIAGTHAPVVRVVNKIDLTGSPPLRERRDAGVIVQLSARSGAGLDLLRAELRERALAGDAGGVFSARARHVDALRRAAEHLAAARTCAQDGGAPELVAEELRAVQQALGEITGQASTEDLLGAIFATFCVGK